MVVFRILFIILAAGTFSLDAGFAVSKDLKENQKRSLLSRRKVDPSVDAEKVSPKRPKRNSVEEIKNNDIDDQGSKENKSPNIQKEKSVSTYSPLLKYSPVKAERDYFDTFRIPLALEEYKQGKKKTDVKSPDVRKLYKKNDPGNYFSGTTTFQEKTLFQVDYLFDPEAEVLKKSGGWETNLERMKKGKTPVCYKGIVSKDERSSLLLDEIRKKQNYYRIELQHVTQKDTGTDEDPICEMTHAAHMGKNARLIVKPGSETEEASIIHNGLEKEEALNLLASGQLLVTNVLHFRKGASHINRPTFNEFRKEYWKERAKEISKGTFIPTPPRKTPRRTLFQDTSQ